VAGEADLIVSDALNHASIIDGMRMSKAPRVVYPHKDVAALRELLREAREKGRTDAGGAPVPADPRGHRRRLQHGRRHRAAARDRGRGRGVRGGGDGRRRPRLGRAGRNGRGTVDHFDLHGRVHIQVGTLSKAIGVLGGYVAGSQALRDMLIQRARPFLFSTSHPPAVAAACLAAIHVLLRRARADRPPLGQHPLLQGRAARLGFDTGASETPITPVMMGDSARPAVQPRLFEEGVFAQPVVYPTVALDKARIRTIVTAEHTTEQLDRCLAPSEGGPRAGDDRLGPRHVGRAVRQGRIASFVAGKTLAEAVAPYFAEVAAAIRSGLFDTLGHMDMCKRWLVPWFKAADFAAAPELYEPLLRRWWRAARPWR
jgi:glycine C-acetyltransferase